MMTVSVRRTTPKYAAHPVKEELVQAAPFAWHAPAVVFAALCVMVGVYWDISWHMSIGRDTFWTPAHLLIQAGGMIAGFTSGYVALRTTFGNDQRAFDAGVGNDAEASREREIEKLHAKIGQLTAERDF